MIDSAAVDLFLKELSEVRLPNVFNPYRDRCPLYDHAGSAKIRRANLRNALLGALRFPEISMWVAQDLGHRGGRRTGLALTDEFHLDHHTRLLQTERCALQGYIWCQDGRAYSRDRLACTKRDQATYFSLECFSFSPVLQRQAKFQSRPQSTERA